MYNFQKCFHVKKNLSIACDLANVDLKILVNENNFLSNLTIGELIYLKKFSEK